MKKEYLLLTSLLIWSLSIFGQTPPNYYVAPPPVGVDAPGGGTLANPWATIQYAFDNMPAVTTNALTLHLIAGTYTIAGPLVINAARGGTAGNYFILKNYGSDVVTINGANISDFQRMLSINSASYVIVEGIQFTNLIGNEKSGLFIDGNSNNIEITGNAFFDMHWMLNPPGNPSPTDNVHPLYVLGTVSGSPANNIVITNNQIYNISPGFSEGITINGNVDGFTLEGNTIYDVLNIAIVAAGNYDWVELNHGISESENHARNGTIKNNIVHNCVSPVAISAGIYLDGSWNMTVDGNISYNNGVGFSIGCEQPGNSTNHILRNNIAYNNLEAGLVLGSEIASHIVDNIRVYGNTFYKNYSSPGFGGELTLKFADNVKLRNNIMYADETVVIVVTNNCTNLLLDYNGYYNLNGGDGSTATFDWSGIPGKTTYTSFASYQLATGQDQSPNSVFQNPDFVNGTIPNPDLHLMSTSVCIDAGDPSTDPAYLADIGPLDMDNENRVYNNIIVDKGADETDAVPLPVEYLNELTATPTEKGIDLKWSTAVEDNSAYFDVERSTNNRDWTIVGAMPAFGAAHFYSLTDHFPKMGNNYYRLKQVDVDGQYAYSSISVARWKSENRTAILYPNPSAGAVHIYQERSDILAVKVYSISGSEVRNYTGPISRIDGLPNGFYYCVFLTSGKNISIPFVINRE